MVEGCDIGAKPKDGVWWIYPEDGRTPRVHAKSGDVTKMMQAN